MNANAATAMAPDLIKVLRDDFIYDFVYILNKGSKKSY